MNYELLIVFKWKIFLQEDSFFAGDFHIQKYSINS